MPEKHDFYRFTRPLAALLLAAALVSCSPIVDNRGHVMNDEWKDRIITGQSTREDVQGLLGSPSSRSSFGAETWYYVSTRKEALGFMRPELTDQQVLRVEFSPEGLVQQAEVIDKSKARDITIVERTTPTEGHSLGIAEQLLGNIGRFNKPGGGTAGSASSKRR